MGRTWRRAVRVIIHHNNHNNRDDGGSDKKGTAYHDRDKGRREG